jgi:hypothetical protein
MPRMRRSMRGLLAGGYDALSDAVFGFSSALRALICAPFSGR